MCALDVINPKIHKKTAGQNDKVFPYYAGYSKEFVDRILGSVEVERNGIVLDPWNGSGTTTIAAYEHGFQSLGIDLNPVMIIVAKARMMSKQEHPSIMPLAISIMEWVSKNYRSIELTDGDPLLNWFTPSSASIIRALETRINKVLVSANDYAELKSGDTVSSMSCLASFFYLILFRVSRRLVADFVASNPTWIKSPASIQHRKRPSLEIIYDLFLDEAGMLTVLQGNNKMPLSAQSEANLRVGSAECLDIQDRMVDLIITSPPYCTRIDYAVSTKVELAILRFRHEEFDGLRRRLMGTATVGKQAGHVDNGWGETCIRFLNDVYKHNSSASKGYYYKSHLQYFSSLASAISELSRVLKAGGKLVMVIQDSYYKDVYNNLPLIAAEMADSHGLKMVSKTDFASCHSMSKRNFNSRKYKQHSAVVESVLYLEK